MFLWAKYQKNGRKIFCSLACLQWVLISSLRGLSVGADTINYKINRFDKTMGLSWNNVFENFMTIFSEDKVKDPGYTILEKTFQMFSTNYQLWLAVIAIIFTVPMAIWIYKYSKNVFISFLIYSCLFYEFFAITGHRQTIATAIAVFGGFEFLKRRKFWRFALCILIAYPIHKSVAVYLAIYFVTMLPVNRKYMACILILTALCFALKSQIIKSLGTLMDYEMYGDSKTAGSVNFPMMYIGITAFSIFARKSVDKTSEIINISYHAEFLGLIFLPLMFINENAMRVIQYFSIYIMILIPELLDKLKYRENIMWGFFGSILMIALLIAKNPQYEFFWQ